MTPVVECRGASRWFTPRHAEAVRAVESVDLLAARGEFIAVQGPSGAGKTTLLGLLAGIDLADAGTVSLLGHDLARLSETERSVLRRSRVGIVFQSFGLVAALTVVDNVALPLTLAGLAPTERSERATAALAEVGLVARAASHIDELSGGERQRVGVARAIVNGPELILADEPAGSLDDENADVVLDLLARASRAHTATLILVTHDANSAARADRRYRMRDGRLTAEAH
ncbi:MAG: ABC transporter ATP-binding protein [Candidatus Limnocylindria bacterium]